MPAQKRKKPEKRGIPVVYANAMRIRHNQYEFFIDFGVTLPDTKGVIEMTKVQTSPQHMKAMVLTMVQDVWLYEQNFGKINYPSDEDIKKVMRKLGKPGGAGNAKRRGD